MWQDWNDEQAWADSLADFLLYSLLDLEPCALPNDHVVWPFMETHQWTHGRRRARRSRQRHD